MKSYPKKVYISASWHETEAVFPAFLVEKLISHSITIVGDHPEYKNDDPFNRSWVVRIHKLIADCCALVVIFPKRKGAQTTSPYMFPEVISAALHNIPILIFSQDGVLIKTIKTNAGYNLHFGENKKKVYFDSLDVVKSKVDLEDIDKVLEEVTTLRLSIDAEIIGPFELPGHDNIDGILGSFVQRIKRPIIESYVFNIVPFSLVGREHKEIAKAVFEETGLPCVTALDTIGDSQDMRLQWRETLSNAEFVIVELSELRDACVFEAGTAVGMGADIFVLTKNKNTIIPYGLDNKPILVYKKLDQLKTIVREQCCKEYKRKIYNLDKTYNTLLASEGKALGVPLWFYDPEDRVTPIQIYSASSWLVSISLAIAIWIGFLSAGETDSPLSYISMGISLVFGLTSHLRSTREKLEEKIIGSYKRMFFLSVVVFVFSISALVYSYV